MAPVEAAAAAYRALIFAHSRLVIEETQCKLNALLCDEGHRYEIQWREAPINHERP